MRIIFLVSALILCSCASAFAFGGSPNNLQYKKKDLSVIATAPQSSFSQNDFAQAYAPNSDATELQRQNIIKNSFGKSVTWEIIVAEVQPELSNVIRVQGSSDATHMGVFVYVNTRSDKDMDLVQSLKKGDSLRVQGIVSDMVLRHVVINPAVLER